MKKVLAILLAAVMVLGLAACGSSSNEPAPAANNNSTPAPAANTPASTEPAAAETYKVGMVCIGDDNAAYDRNFYMAADAAKEILAAEGINVEWTYTYNHPEGDPVAVDCEELADDGCIAVFLNSYGQEPAMLTVAADYQHVKIIIVDVPCGIFCKHFKSCFRFFLCQLTCLAAV